MRRWMLLVMGLAACGGKEGPGAAPDAGKPVVAATDAGPTPVDAAPAKASKVADGEAYLAKGPSGADGVKTGLALADALAQEGTDKAKLTSARVRLMAVAKALGDEAASPALGEGGVEKQARLALAAATGLEPKTVADAARGLLVLTGATEPGVTSADLKAALAAKPEGDALAIAAKRALALGLDAGPTTAGFESLLTNAGALLCDGCKEAAALSPEQLQELAAKAKTDATQKLVGTLGEALAGAGANVLTVAALELEGALGGARDGVILPVAVGDLGTTESLGGRGLEKKLPSVAVAVVGPDGVRIGTRAVVSRGGGLVAIPEPLQTASLISSADIQAGTPDPTTKAIPILAERAKAVAAASTAFGQGKVETGAVDIAVLPGASVANIKAAANALGATGLAGFALIRPGVVGGALPMYIEVADPAIEARTLATFEKPLLVVVSKEAIDVWAPEKAKAGGLAVGADAEKELPTIAEAGWRGETLARLRVPRPPVAPDAPDATGKPRFSAESVRDVRAVTDFWLTKTKAGPVVHVVAGEGAEAWDVLALAQALMEAPPREGQPQLDVAATWPGAACPPAQNGKPCASALVVAFSGLAVPSERGLSGKPKKGDKTEKPPDEHKGPEPSEEFCNKADIQTQMRKRAGAFRFCYEKELQLEKDLKGRLTVGFTIGLQGGVKSLSTGGDLPSKAVADCVKKEVGKITFAAPQGGECRVSWPFVFKSD